MASVAQAERAFDGETIVGDCPRARRRYAATSYRTYIAPALKPDRSANPRWITRSDWGMERRIVATPRTERLFDLYKIYVLAGRPGSAEASYLVLQP